MTSTQSFELNKLRNIVAAYTDKRPGCPPVNVIPSHIDANGTPYGYVESTSRAVIDAIEALAR